MSCHDIGRGMNEVVRMTISLFDKGEISRESAVKIIATCGAAVNWCDGNEGEAIEYINRCRCGKCLRLVHGGEKLYSVLDLPYNFKENRRIDPDRLRIVSYGLCEECFDPVLRPFCDGMYSVDDLKKYIEERYDIKDFTSEGEPPAYNNGCKWVRGTDWFD